MKMLSQLRLVDWIILCLALSVIGGILDTLASVAIDIAALGDSSFYRSKPILDLLATDLIYTILGCLFVNALGALFLVSIFAWKRRHRAS
jgi:hypothetical protein